tara:strand:+ start:1773 stop:2477 length:705 start_codon:yes stop_codon:yes gene_type:complete
MTKLSVIFPCYNEAENLPFLINDCTKHLEKYSSILEIILVNNGSNDNTEMLFKTLLNESKLFRTVHVNKNQGYGYGILQGLSKANGEYIGWMHADLQTDPKDIIKVLDLIDEKKNLYIKGQRRNRPFFDNIFTLFMSLICSITFKKIIFDINAQPNIFPKKFFSSWKNPPDHFGLDTYCYCMAIKNNLEILKFNVFFGKRIAGVAHLNNLQAKIKYSVNAYKYILHLKKNIDIY